MCFTKDSLYFHNSNELQAHITMSWLYIIATSKTLLIQTHLSLQELKKCFDAQDVPLLQATIAKMPEQEAIYYMKRCVDAGLWVPGKTSEDEPTMRENAGEASQPAEAPKPNVSIDDVD